MIDSLSITFAKLDSGVKLTETQRQQLRETIGIIVKSYETNMQDFITSSQQEFDERGLDMTVYVPKGTIDKYNNKQTQSETTATKSDPL